MLPHVHNDISLTGSVDASIYTRVVTCEYRVFSRVIATFELDCTRVYICTRFDMPSTIDTLNHHHQQAGHPLDPLSSQEISTAADIVRKHASSLELPLERLVFNSISLKEPVKLAVLKYLGVVNDPDVLATKATIKRQADVSVSMLAKSTRDGLLIFIYLHLCRSSAWTLLPLELLKPLWIFHRI